ncbi:MAG: 5-formyltetrahydrofolate cyclo-ligase [Psychromonas sp.]|nr:5-formyltetrahydrofolate cyclo-ligase [Psychromonas sp.]
MNIIKEPLNMVIQNSMTASSIQQARSQIRQQIRTARRDLPGIQQQADAAKLFARLIKHNKVKEAQHIGISLASDGEIDTFDFIKWCWANNKQVYLPVVHPFSKGHLLFLHYATDTEMELNRYGIYEPKLEQLHACAMHKLDIVFTPLVAFDLQGNRIGMGGGYYDRMLAPWFKDKKGPYPIGLAHDCQQVETLPIEEWDVPLPEIITPSQHYQW